MPSEIRNHGEVLRRENASDPIQLTLAPWCISGMPVSCRSAYLARYPAAGGVKRLLVSATPMSVACPGYYRPQNQLGSRPTWQLRKGKLADD